MKLIGLYLGWRGRSLPGFLDYTTVWSRKAAAERVGDGDASEFVERLQRLYLRANATDRESVGGVSPFMALVTIGHSFGGQVLLKAVARPFERQLVQRSVRPADILKPPNIQPMAAERVPMDELGDVNILLNPATEAYQFARIDDLHRQMSYPMTQTPQVVVFTADNDYARKILFPLSRLVTLPFRPAMRNRYQGRLYGTALGVLKTQWTHEMDPASAAPSLTDADYTNNDGARLRDFDFSGELCLGRVRIRLAPGFGAPIANSPLSVVVTHKNIIKMHNGIFRPDFVDFLCAYVGFVSGKRLMIHQQRRHGG